MNGIFAMFFKPFHHHPVLILRLNHAGDVVRLDRKLAMAAIDEDCETDGAGSAVVL